MAHLVFSAPENFRGENMNKKLEQARYEVDEFFQERPTVKIGMHKFYIDEDKKELRSAHNKNVITFGEYEIVQLAMKILNRV